MSDRTPGGILGETHENIHMKPQELEELLKEFSLIFLEKID